MAASEPIRWNLFFSLICRDRRSPKSQAGLQLDFPINMEEQSSPKGPDESSTNIGKMKNQQEVRQCRYCLEEQICDSDAQQSDELVSPCKCKGDQKWVHLRCLRKWQRSILISQPTHPAFYLDDKRHHICGVCKQKFNFPPPTRQELMSELTGKELANMLEQGFLIVSGEKSSREIACIIQHGLPNTLDLRHWMCGVFLIIDSTPHHISAVNLTRQIEPQEYCEKCVELCLKSAKQKLEKVCVNPGIATMETCNHSTDTANENTPIELKKKNLSKLWEPLVEVRHFVGGPCEEFQAAALCLLRLPCNLSPESISKEINIDKDIYENIKCVLQWKSGEGAAEQAGQLFYGDLMSIYNMAYAASIRYEKSVAVHAYWGDARWTRTQLLGELAKGSWGMCKAEGLDVICSQVPERFRAELKTMGIDPNDLPEKSMGAVHLWNRMMFSKRLVFAPVGEMTEIDDFDDSSSDSEDSEERRKRLEVEEKIRRAHREKLRKQVIENHKKQQKSLRAKKTKPAVSVEVKQKRAKTIDDVSDNHIDKKLDEKDEEKQCNDST